MEDNQDVNSSLITAVQEGNLKRAKELINRFGLSHSREWSEGYVLLRNALKNRHAAVARLLLESGCKVNSINSINPSDTPLHFAVINGDIEIVKMILDRGADINAKNGSGETPLYNAIVNENIKLAELLLKHKADVNASDKWGTSPLHAAVQRECLKIVEHFLRYGADFNCVHTAECERGYTPLHFAVDSSDKEMITLLLSKGANVDIKAEDNVTPLHIAVEGRSIDIIEDLRNRGACIHSCTWKNGYSPLYIASLQSNEVVKLFLNKFVDVDAIMNGKLTPLHIATKAGRRKVVKLLLQHGAKVDHQDKDGKTTLFLAVQEGCLKIIEDLLTNGADVNNTSYNGCTPLHSAVRSKKKEVAELLISYGADINAQDKNGRTPIFHAVENADIKMTNLFLTNRANIKDDRLNIAAEKGYIEIVEALLQHDVDINASDKYGRTALHFTALYSKSRDSNINGEIAKLLLSRGANVDAQTRYGETALHTGVRSGYAKVVETLLDYNANVNSRAKNDITPLHISVERGNKEISTMPLNKGADVNAKKKDGMTVLHIAAKRGHEEVLKLLLECGAEVNSKMDGGVTPLHLSALNGYPEIIKTLLEFGASIDSRDEQGRTALHRASRTRYVNVVNTLLDYGSDINITSINNHTPVDDARITPRAGITAEALKRHIVKLKTANLYVSEKNLLSMRSSGGMRDFHDECEKEIASMKHEKIYNLNISFYDIFAKSTSSLVGYMKNENIVQVFKSDEYKTKFPIYAGMIENNFRKAMERKDLLEEGNQIFNYFPVLPYDCTEKIFSYLSNEELRILMDAKTLSITNSNDNIDDVVIGSSISQEPTPFKIRRNIRNELL